MNSKLEKTMPKLPPIVRGQGYLVRYRYDNPSSAGPWKGKATMPDKYAKGDTIISFYGRATVTSCRKAKPVPSA